MIAVLLVLYIVLPGIQCILFIMDLPFVTLLDGLNYVFSLFSFSIILNHIVITVKIPWLQNRIPYDKMVKFHVFTGIFVIIAIYFHAAYKILIGKYINLVSWMILALFTVLYVFAILWIEAPFVRKVRRAVLKKLGRKSFLAYDTLKFFHGYFFMLLGFLSFLHIRDAGVQYSSFLYVSAYAFWYPVIVLILVLYAKVRKLWIPEMVLVKNTQINGTSILTFRAKDHSPIAYKAGQFGYIRWVSPGLPREEHPFSFLSCPSDETVSLGIKVLGDYTETITKIPQNSRAKIFGGFGNFIPSFSKEKVCLIGSGIGIVPIVSLVRNMINNPPAHEVLCFLAVNTRDELLAEEELVKTAAVVKNLSLTLLVYQEDGILYSKDFFREHIPDPESFHYYLCSSMLVRGIVLDSLELLHVPKKRLHFEAFSY